MYAMREILERESGKYYKVVGKSKNMKKKIKFRTNIQIPKQSLKCANFAAICTLYIIQSMLMSALAVPRVLRNSCFT